MREQSQILNEYKRKFSGDTLKKMQARTGINYSRLFRLLQGSEMKLREYNRLREVLDSGHKQCHFSQLTQKCQRQLPIKTLKTLENFMQLQLSKQYLL